jgi:hypothetical protein
MPSFNVQRYKDGQHYGLPSFNIEAENEKEAAEKVCGERLIQDGGKLGTYRAKVWPSGQPGKIVHFSTPPRDIPT